MRQKQIEIDYDDCKFRRMIAEAPMPGVRRDRAQSMRAVLLAIYEIDGGRGCWPGQARLSRDSGCCERTVREAIEILEQRYGYLLTFRKQPPGEATRKTLTHYVIIWTELERRRQLGCGGLDNLPVDIHNLPVDIHNLPVDIHNLPVDPRTHYISARTVRNGRGTEEEIPVPVPVGPQTVAEEALSGQRQRHLRGDNSDVGELGADNPGSSLWSKIDLALDPRLDLPELRLARQRPVEPLAARWQVADGSWRDLRGSVFSAVKLDALKRPSQLARWHRRQLSAASPYFGPTELDLIMILALARHAVSCPVEEIRRNRVAYWVHLCVRQKWTTGLRYLGPVLDVLESLREEPTMAAEAGLEVQTGREERDAVLLTGWG